MEHNGRCTSVCATLLHWAYHSRELNNAVQKCICKIVECSGKANGQKMPMLQSALIILSTCGDLPANCICPNCEMYLSQMQNIFLKILKCFFFPFKKKYFTNLSGNANKLQSALVILSTCGDLLANCICPNCEIYVSQMQNVFL